MPQVDRFKALTGLMVGLALTAACGGGPTKEEYFASAEGFAKEEKYPEAIVQYRNAIAVDAQYGEARFKLAEAYVRTNDLARAMGEYIRAADLMPENTEAQLQATRFLLLARRFEDARTRAESVLARDPKNVDAQIAKATAMAGMRDIRGGIAEVEEAIKIDPDNARSHMMLGAMQISQQRAEEAEAAFKRAVEVDPTSVEAKQALASFYWSAGKLPEAEDGLKQAVAADPNNLASQRALATFLIAQGRAVEAEAPLKTVADTTKTPAARLALADYYLGQRRLPDARPIFDELAKTDDGYIPARIRLAQLDYSTQKPEAGHKHINEVLAKDAKQVDALVMRAQMLLAERKADEALASAQAAVAANANSAAAQNALGDVLVVKAEPATALRAYNEALRINPRLVGAKLKVAQLQMQSGDTEGAVQSTEEAVRQSQGNPAARMLRARALIARRDYSRAQEDLTVLAKEFPKAPQVHAQIGELQLAQQNRVAARKSFDTALALSPDSFEGLRGRVLLDLLEGKAAQARDLVDQQLTRAPRSPQLLLLSAGVHAAQNNQAKQEEALNKLIEVDPNNLQGFAALAGLYVRQGKLDQARQRYETLSARGASAVAAKTMVGLIYEAQNRPVEAKAAYEKLLASDPDSAVAANNLAWRYAEDGGNLDVALQLAQTAKRGLPDAPEVNDTLGWIYLKKELFSQAISSFQAAGQAAPTSPDYKYHLGMAYAKAGNKVKAAEEFDAALKLKPDYKEAAAARRALAAGN